MVKHAQFHSQQMLKFAFNMNQPFTCINVFSGHTIDEICINLQQHFFVTRLTACITQVDGHHVVMQTDY